MASTLSLTLIQSIFAFSLIKNEYLIFIFLLLKIFISYLFVTKKIYLSVKITS
jgi:hypothetical protein